MNDLVVIDGIRWIDSPTGRKRLCSAVLRTGEQCKRIVSPEEGYCKSHNRMLEKTTNTLAFRHGLHSKFKKRFSGVGKNLLSRIDELREDPSLWSLKDDAAYITALMDIRAEAAGEGVSYEQIRTIQRLYEQAHREYNKGEPTFERTFVELGTAINNRVDEFAASRDVLDLIQRRTQVVETEQRLQHAKAYTLEVDQAFSLVMQFLDVVKGAVKDMDTMQAIKTGVIKLLRVYEEQAGDIVNAEIIDEEESS
jgi:hypothetical protein